MPELPEVETVMRGMAPLVAGQVIKTVDQRRPDLRTPFPPHLKERLCGTRVSHLTRRAKYILLHLDSDLILVLHLGMSGRIHLVMPDQPEPYRPEKHDHLIVGFANGAQIIFTDPRRFGQVMLVAKDALQTHPAFAALGPEPLGNAFAAPVLARMLHKRQSPIKTVLLDQKTVAGLGNIYVCEALYDSHIAPERPASSLSDTETEVLTRAIKAVLTRAIAAGGSSLKDYRQVNGTLGYFQHHFAVYGKAGEACPACTCDVSKTGGIQQIRQGGRSTFYCPREQI